MCKIMLIIAISAAFGVVWGSKHPETPFDAAVATVRNGFNILLTKITNKKDKTNEHNENPA